MKKGVFLFFLLFGFSLHARQPSPLLTLLPVKNLEKTTTEKILKEIEQIFIQRKKGVVMAATRLIHEELASDLGAAITKAQDLQFNFQDSRAINILLEALEAFDSHHSNADDISKLADAYLFVAFCHKNLGETEKMNKNLDEAARLNPDLTPSKMLYPPSLIAFFDQAKDRIWTKGEFSQIRVEANIEGAHVYVNSAYKGKAPLRLDRYPLGEHHIYALSDGKMAYKKIHLKTGGNPTVTLRLTEKKSTPQKKKKSPSFSLKDFEKQAGWLKASMAKAETTQGIGIAIVHQGKKRSILLHPIGFENIKPQIFLLKEEDSPKEIADQIMAQLLGSDPGGVGHQNLTQLFPPPVDKASK